MQKWLRFKWITFAIVIGAMITLSQCILDLHGNGGMGWATIKETAHALWNGHYTALDIIIMLFRALDQIWHYQIVTIEKEPIAVANIVIALISLIIGLRIASTLSTVIRERALAKLELETSVRGILEKMSYYALITLVTLIALDISNVPLTVFKFVGGALAIGLGFGSQNIINNFISGLIMMVERPIRVGDMIEVNNTPSTVVNIGARCTHLRTSNNIDILVPNSSMLADKIINWTLTGGGIVRTNITVSVPITNDPQKIETILLKTVQHNKDILPKPEPKVFLTNLNEGLLNFEIHFWVDILSGMERRRIVSDLHHMMMAAMRKENIEFTSFTNIAKSATIASALHAETKDGTS